MIKNIEIKGKSIPVNYGMNALAEYSEMRNISMNSVLSLDTSTMNMMDYLALIYIGVKDGARVAKQDCMFKSIDEFLDFADENKEIITKVADVFAQYGKEGESKKK